MVRLDGSRDLPAQEARHLERLRAVVGHHLAAAVQTDVARVANLGRARLRVDADCLRSLNRAGLEAVGFRVRRLPVDFCLRFFVFL